MDKDNFAKAQGHWILAQMGKRVLRPGGRELTQKLISSLDVTSNDNIVEFAPGLGYTASLVLNKKPKSYVGVDADSDVVSLLNRKFQGENIKFQLGNATQTGLDDNSKDKVYGEAMLTMHVDHRKSEIIREAHRILRKGGLYAIHELGLMPEDLDDDIKSKVQRDLAMSIRVNARPLTQTEWTSLLENEGFKVNKVETNKMHLLKPKRMIEDEGFFRFLKIRFNILTHPQARKRIVEMKEVFQKHQSKMNAIVIVAEKI
ncbi:MAG: class I SAM-dependent methyltransferase [Ignavibacteriaceae bacterium]|jgi:ubiquinone/menaquinone biosynthesis C-methylase UbiE|nr:MAG: class I SAM-dependent methyltransferase [Chlorobiota bacterium]KXK01631.1 MAG: arsenite S-adenosylmethyltransferase [Chlorobi bacterium OLB4]MBV6398654.1 hypothetical protein [Ignavibacteria bacterium]MCC6885178.1 methyltransferase domain-containing protein [Ignavibacteriales bacterium]MCE7952032.1 class I SAM-dependent methyltransferase [Chlorobi bacterium CHB7]MDL1886410.1 class I SAM-dependent methyltransferase [Ignavibacteria bacterium CHB1]MEB2330436.1 class I SAM-dependent methy